MANPVRARLMRVVCQNPGLSVMDLARRLDVGRGTIRYHAGVLKDAGHIEVIKNGKIPAVVARGTDFRVRPSGLEGKWSVGAIVAALNHPVRRAIVASAATDGPLCYYRYRAGVESIGRHDLVVARDTFRHHCHVLEDAGLLGRAVLSRRTTWRLVIDLSHVMRHQREGLLLLMGLRPFHDALEAMGQASPSQVLAWIARRGKTRDLGQTRRALRTLESIGLVVCEPGEGVYRLTLGGQR